MVFPENFALEWVKDWYRHVSSGGVWHILASLKRIDGQKIIAHLYGIDLKRLFYFRPLNKHKIV